MNVRALMNPKVQYAGTDATLADVARIMAKNDCGVVPVLNAGNRVVGIITDRDICLGLARLARPASEIAVTEVMSKRVYACGPEEDVRAALETMRNRRVRRLPVLDSRGKLVGILSMDDVVLHAETTRARKKDELDYGQTIDTLKAIYRRPAQKKELVLHP